MRRRHLSFGKMEVRKGFREGKHSGVEKEPLSPFFVDSIPSSEESVLTSISRHPFVFGHPFVFSLTPGLETQSEYWYSLTHGRFLLPTSGLSPGAFRTPKDSPVAEFNVRV